MDNLERRSLLGAAGLVGVAALASAAKAGPLNPPAGTVASTGRTTDEIYNKIPSGGSGDGRIAIPSGSAITISNPGSYVLTGNIGSAAGGGNGITIGADQVTLDLNGYAVSSGIGTGNGVSINNGLKGIVVRNGIVNGFLTGVSVGASNAQVLIEDLLIREAKTNGVVVSGTSTRGVRIRRCTIVDTGATTSAADGVLSITGIQINGGACTVQDCTVQRLIYNGSATGTLRGIQFAVAGGNTVERCTVMNDATVLAANGAGMVFNAVTNIAIYRDNSVINFATKYSGASATDGGGNV